MRGCAGCRISVTLVAEYVAFEADRSVASVLTGRGGYARWLRCVVIWLARHVGRVTLQEIAHATATCPRTAATRLREAELLYDGDPDFLSLMSTVARALHVEHARVAP